MKGKRILVGCAALGLALCGSAMANEIYKWTDADGNIHYEDRPSGAATEERLALVYQRTNSAGVQKRTQARIDGQVARQEARDEADAAAEKAADAKAQAEADARKCQTSRAQLQTMLQAPRLYREDENGERQYLDENERQEARTRAEELIAEYCTS